MCCVERRPFEPNHARRSLSTFPADLQPPQQQELLYFCLLLFDYTPEAMNMGLGIYQGSGGGARGCGFEEWVGAYARTEGAVSYSPRSLRVCVCVHLLKLPLLF